MPTALGPAAFVDTQVHAVVAVLQHALDRVAVFEVGCDRDVFSSRVGVLHAVTPGALLTTRAESSAMKRLNHESGGGTSLSNKPLHLTAGGAF